MNENYVYMDETSIDSELICSICKSPLNDPCCTSCGETFCRACITDWIQTQNGSCPLCRQIILIKDLKRVPRALQNMLDRLQIKCILGGQTELQRGNFDDHIQKVCPKMLVVCPSADIKCPWTGQRDQLNKHLVDCRFEPMRSVITQFLAENQQLKDQANQQTIEITARKNTIEELLARQKQLLSTIESQEIVNQRLKDHVNRLTNYLDEHPYMIIQHQE